MYYQGYQITPPSRFVSDDQHLVGPPPPFVSDFIIWQTKVPFFWRGQYFFRPPFGNNYHLAWEEYAQKISNDKSKLLIAYRGFDRGELCQPATPAAHWAYCAGVLGFADMDTQPGCSIIGGVRSEWFIMTLAKIKGAQSDDHAIIHGPKKLWVKTRLEYLVT